MRFRDFVLAVELISLVVLGGSVAYHVFVDHALSLEYVCQPPMTTFSAPNIPEEAAPSRFNVPKDVPSAKGFSIPQNVELGTPDDVRKMLNTPKAGSPTHK